MRSDTFDFEAIEKKWQGRWKEANIDAAPRVPGHRSYYCLVMFPYPSGQIHMGHVRNYVIGDVMARYHRSQGCEVLHPIGWDAFGLPAENAAIKHGIDPEKWTRDNIAAMRFELSRLALSYDWSRELATCDIDYYRWNQWFFIKMFEKGLAFRKAASVNWCPQCGTVLANEQVHDGKCWRCDTPVKIKELEQWFFKITAYAKDLLDDMAELEKGWPSEVLSMQRHWIGQSVGAEVDFKTSAGLVKVFTTRPDTLFGATYLALSPEHPFVSQLTTTEQKSDIEKYGRQTQSLSAEDRQSEEREKTGVFTGSYAVNPVNDEKIPIWVTDYVLSGYGTGAIMAVPAHDLRDFKFAQKFRLPITEVIRGKESNFPKEAYTGDGVLVNSGEFDGIGVAESKKKITQKLSERGLGKEAVHYRLRDWLVSRQRYWGTPIPMIHCEQCGVVPVSEEDLPVRLPSNVKIRGEGESPLKYVESFIQCLCPRCGRGARRETEYNIVLPY